jgi:hypothetical protein
MSILRELGVRSSSRGDGTMISLSSRGISSGWCRLASADRERPGPTVDDYEVGAITQDYREAVNARLSDTGMSLDENSDVVADAFIDDNPRELLNDAMFNAKLPSIIERHRR